MQQSSLWLFIRIPALQYFGGSERNFYQLATCPSFQHIRFFSISPSLSHFFLPSYVCFLDHIFFLYFFQKLFLIVNTKYGEDICIFYFKHSCFKFLYSFVRKSKLTLYINYFYRNGWYFWKHDTQNCHKRPAGSTYRSTLCSNCQSTTKYNRSIFNCHACRLRFVHNWNFP